MIEVSMTAPVRGMTGAAVIVELVSQVGGTPWKMPVHFWVGTLRTLYVARQGAEAGEAAVRARVRKYLEDGMIDHLARVAPSLHLGPEVDSRVDNLLPLVMAGLEATGAWEEITRALPAEIPS